LQVRAQVIRRLRERLASETMARERILHSRAYRVAVMMRRTSVVARPRHLWRSVTRGLSRVRNPSGSAAGGGHPQQ
jgi:hypothetical protein